MRFALIVALLAATGCGKDIGDACILSSDCDPNGTQFCDTSGPSGGYCTVLGCDVGTCPGDSKCIRFFTGSFENRLCAEAKDCSLDELCANTGHCVPRSSEIRYCMATCSGPDDCRDGYECRDADLQIDHGGEPIDTGNVRFCAPAPTTP